MDSDSLWSPGERKLLEEGIIPSPNSIELQKTTLSDYMQRLATPDHVAELFHENSKLTPSSTLTVPGDERKLQEVREWFFSTAYAMKPPEVEASQAHQFRITLEDLPEGLQDLLRPFSQRGPAAELLYGLDLLTLYGGRLYRTVVWTEYLWVERSVSDGELEGLREAVLDQSDHTLSRAQALLFIVGCPWRYMMLYGPRGYRHTLIDAGRLWSQLQETAGRHRLRLAMAQNFYDCVVDRFLYADGVERSALMILAVSGGPT